MKSFANTWVTTISPMTLRVLEANMEKSMECNINFNGEFGYEINDGSPIIKPMLGRPKKVRREANETRKSGKLPRINMQMTCSNCGGKNHNKRSCHRVAGSQNATTNDGDGPSNIASSTSTTTRPRGRPRGRPRKETITSEAPPRSRGRPKKKTTIVDATPRPKERPRNETTIIASTLRPKGRPRSYHYSKTKRKAKERHTCCFYL